MKKCTDIYKENMGESTFGASIYIDPLGYEYPKSVVVCHDCMFNFGHDSCVLFKEEGLDDRKIKDKLLHVQREKECQYFLIKDFSEGGDEDEKAREEVKEISKRLNYPKEYWRRSNIHKVMDEKGIGYVVFKNKSCITCEYCDNEYSSIGYCKFHNIELFLEDRYCENYQGNNIKNNGNKEILITAALYDGGTRLIPINEAYSLKASTDHTFSIVRLDDAKELFSIEPYLLRSVEFSDDEGYVYAKYVHKVDVIDPVNKAIIKTIGDEEEEEETTWPSSVTESKWFAEIDKVKFDQSAQGVTTGDRMNNCERCENVNRNSHYPDGSPTGLICSLKKIFVTANGVCSDFSR